MNADEEDYPQFGKSDTDPNFVVKEFYGFWQSYFTKRTYVWKEEYDTRDAPNRWVRRKMEQENSKTTEQVMTPGSNPSETILFHTYSSDKWKFRPEKREVKVFKLWLILFVEGILE